MASERRLGRLEPVPLEEVWFHEAQHFTPWLARPENLALLGEALGIELELEGTEVGVGPFSADVRCRDTANGTWVVIENQIRRTDHSHLGQILTYAAGLDAKTIVWIAAKFTDEHRATLDWLNENSADEVAFFGLEIELWRIGGSDPAPKFNIVCEPNDWSRSVRDTAAGGLEGGSKLAQLRFEFWSAFKAWLDERGAFRGRKPNTSNWMDFSMGSGRAHLCAVASSWNSVKNEYSPQLRVEVVLHPPQAKARFAELERRKPEIQSMLAEPLTWHNPAESKSAKVYVQSDGDFTKRELWPRQFEWIESNMKELRRVFAPLVEADLSDSLSSA